MSEKKMTHGQTSKFVEHSGLISPCMGIALEYVIWNSAKARSRKYGLEFNIEPSDITIPETCPLLGITLVQGDKKVCDSSPSLDRINPKRGYVKGNIRVISFRANTIKAGRTEDELQQELLACLSAMQPMGATYAMHGIQEIF